MLKTGWHINVRGEKWLLSPHPEKQGAFNAVRKDKYHDFCQDFDFPCVTQTRAYAERKFLGDLIRIRARQAGAKKEDAEYMRSIFMKDVEKKSRRMALLTAEAFLQ